MDFTPLNLPRAPLRLTRREGIVYVWCGLRRRELVLTPEEWVRQHVIHWLMETYSIPSGYLFSEQPVKYHALKHRADIVAYDPNRSPRLIVECKAPEIPLTEAVFLQAARYNHQLQVDYLLLTNGLQHIFATIDRATGEVHYQKDLVNELSAMYS